MKITPRMKITKENIARHNNRKVTEIREIVDLSVGKKIRGRQLQ